MTRRWRACAGDCWQYTRGQVDMRVNPTRGRGAFVWHLTTLHVMASGRRTYAKAAGARAACERVARRLGVAL